MIESAIMLFSSCILNVLGVVHSYLAPVVTCGYLSLSEMFVSVNYCDMIFIYTQLTSSYSDYT